MAPLPWRILGAVAAAAALSTTSNYRTPTTSLRLARTTRASNYRTPTTSSRRALTTRAAASTSSTAPTEKPTNKLARAAKFWQRAVPIVGKYVAGPVAMQLRERVLGECLSDDECEVVWDDAHASGAEQARKVVDELGGFYVKTGQIIASRSDLFPRQYSDALAGLTDLVDPMDGAYVRGIVAAEVLRPGEAWDDVFESWDDAPLGAASVAQAHRAKLTAKYGGKGLPPSFVQPFRCRRVSLANFSLVNAPFWAVHPVYSENVWVRNLRVNTSWDRPNTDGVDPEACKDVLVENCVISAGDDAVALKTGRDADGCVEFNHWFGWS